MQILVARGNFEPPLYFISPNPVDKGDWERWVSWAEDDCGELGGTYGKSGGYGKSGFVSHLLREHPELSQQISFVEAFTDNVEEDEDVQSY